MPIVRVEIREGKSPEYKKAILDGVHAALVESFKIPDYDRMQLLYELPATRFEAGHKSDNVTIVTITAFAGRSREAKKGSTVPLPISWRPAPASPART